MRTSLRKKYQPQNNQFTSQLQSIQEKTKKQVKKTHNYLQQTLDKPSRSVRKKMSIKAYHFSNAIYQGQMKAYHRTGRGLLLHDNGLTGIIRSGSNRLKDHNIFLGQNIIISVLYKQHEIEFVYKNDQKILILTMQKKQNSFIIKSPGFLIELDQYIVFRLRFKNNKLVEKVALTLVETDQIIGKEKFDKVMGSNHIEALKLNFYDTQSPQINVIRKNQNELHVGYIETKPYEYTTTYQMSYSPQQAFKHQLHGLGFILSKRNLDPNKQFCYQFQILSRGFYSHGKLQYYGEIYYENGNHYFGRIRGQKMHGNGVLVYERQRKFVYGEFFEGKPLKLDENIEFRLDTQQGRAIYMSLRKKLHGQDPQVWIDNEVHDQPSPQYFLKELQECMNFRYEEQEVNNMLKKQQELWLSRKVQHFQQQTNPLYKKPYSGRLSNSLYSRNNYLTSQYLHNISKRQNQILRRQIDIEEIRRSRSKHKENEKDKQEFGTVRSSKRDVQLNETPIQKISNFQVNKSQLNNPQFNDSIINNFTFSGQKKYNENEKITSSINNDINPRTSRHTNSKIDINEDFLNYELIQPHQKKAFQDDFNINIFSPIEKKSRERSLSRSMSKSSRRSDSGPRSLSRSQQGSKSKVSFKIPQQKNELNLSRRRPQKTSIIDKLYSEASLRALKLEKQYEILQKSYKNKNSPYKNLPNNTSSYANEKTPFSSSRRFQVDDFSPSKNNLPYCQKNLADKLVDNFLKEEQEIKSLVAANEALRLANSNKVKQEKYLQYDHYTHKKKFDYTSDTYNIPDKKYQISGTYDPRYNKTPQKSQQYNNSNITDSQKTVRRQKVDSVVNRLYPHKPQYESNSREFQQNKIYDSSYEQSRPLNKIGRTRQDERTINFQEPVYKYSVSNGLKSSILKHNVVVKS